MEYETLQWPQVLLTQRMLVLNAKSLVSRLPVVTIFGWDED